MRRIILAALVSTSVATGTTSAQSSQEPGWSAHLAATAVRGTSGGGAETSLGAALGLEYRASRRLGFELGVANADFEHEVDIDFFDLVTITLESELSATPILAQLDWHLTPDRRVDLFLGPVAGYVLYGDQKVRIRGAEDDQGVEPVFRLQTDDGFAWGAHVGLDAALGHSGAFFTARASYFKAEVETDAFADELGDSSFDLDPVLVQVGIGYRF